MARNSRPSIQNIDSWRIWIWENKILLNLINNEPDIDKIFLYAKDPYEAKYQLLINKRESTCLKDLNDSKAVVEYSNDMDDICKNMEDYNSDKKQKILIVFDDMIADMLRNYLLEEEN